MAPVIARRIYGVHTREGRVEHYLVPGAWVRHPAQLDWGPGQIQSAIGNRVTVNFVEAGKKVINTDVVALIPDDERLTS